MYLVQKLYYWSLNRQLALCYSGRSNLSDSINKTETKFIPAATSRNANYLEERIYLLLKKYKSNEL